MPYTIHLIQAAGATSCRTGAAPSQPGVVASVGGVQHVGHLARAIDETQTSGSGGRGCCRCWLLWWAGLAEVHQVWKFQEASLPARKSLHKYRQSDSVGVWENGATRPARTSLGGMPAPLALNRVDLGDEVVISWGG